MLLEISETVKPIISDPNIRMVVLYRIDGTPILAEIKDKNIKILDLLYRLENQIKDILYHIFSGDLDDISFKFRDIVVKMYPVSRTLVLAILAKEETSIYKLEADIESVCMKIKELVGYEHLDSLHTVQ